ncbi:MAG TPA: flagellar biosynthesis anti-sigma factor FlgM [Steroidobacteraceae bacterium]|nr:flagellar biosynthesis anti-sigma factor FlgM [Gammaproteobacteria bacterium]HEV2286316.1 flagellar biosynthesis anti-sigma factor FlgM [Steroidobacteraceae bacterium]
MSNKINDLTTNVAAGRPSAVTPVRDTVTGGGNAAPAPATGEVHITDTAAQLASLEQSLRDSPAVDSAKVAQLSSAIEQGTYQVNSEHVATQLMQMERALAGLGKKDK